MKIEKITIKGFRCFGPEGVSLELSDGLTALVGGKRAGTLSVKLDDAVAKLKELNEIEEPQERELKNAMHVDQDRQGINVSSLALAISCKEPRVNRSLFTTF